MPQMAPLAWYPLMITFILLMILFSIMNFWLITPKAPQHKTETSHNKMNWKW